MSETPYPDVEPGQVKAVTIPPGEPWAGWIRVSIGRNRGPKHLNLSQSEAGLLVAELIRLADATVTRKETGPGG